MKKLLVKIAAKEKPVKEISKDKPFLIYPDKALLEIYLPNLKTISDSELRKAISELPWKDLEYSELDLDISNLNTVQQEIVYEMIFLKSYFFDNYKTKNKKIKLKTIQSSKAQKLNFSLRDKLIDSVLFCRDIVSANASEINPGSLEILATEIADKCPQIKLKTVSATEAKKLGMECLLAVGKESLINSGKEFHPRLLVLEFDPEMGNAEIEDCGQSYLGTARKRTSSRLRRTNDRSVLQVHEDHEDDENVEIEDCEQSHDVDPYDLSRLYYWFNDAKNASAEIDYLIEIGKQIIPVEVKASHRGRLKSLRYFMDKYKAPLGIRISANPLSFEEGILSVPFYAVSEINRLVALVI